MMNKIARNLLVGSLMATFAFAASAQTKTKIFLPAISIIFSPVYIAEDAGYFKEAGLDVEMGVLPGPAALNALIGGSGDFTAIAGLVQLRAGQRGQKTLAIAGLLENATAEVVLSKEASARLAAAKTPIDRAKALKGLTLAVDSPNGLPHAFLRYIGRQAGIDADRDVRLVFMAPPGMNAALEKNEIDGFVFSSPFTLEATRRGAELWVSGPRGDFPGVNPTTYNLLIARDGYCANAPAVCRSMVAAIEKSMQLIANEPQKALSLMARRFEKTDPEILKAAYESFQKNSPARPRPMGKAFEHTVDIMTAPQDDKAALKTLAKSLYTDEFVSTKK